MDLTQKFLILPFILFPSTTIGLTHSDSFTGSIISTMRILPISSLTFSLYLGFNRYGCFLTGYALGFRLIFIISKSPTIPFKLESLVGNKSLYSCNNTTTLSTISSSQKSPMFANFGSSSEPMFTYFMCTDCEISGIFVLGPWLHGVPLIQGY